MASLKTLTQWLVLALVLLYVPEESTLLMFDSEPSDRYGELLIEGADQTVVVSKNAQEELVEWNFLSDFNSISLHGKQSVRYGVSGQSYAPPYSISVVSLASGQQEAGSSRTVRTRGGTSFKPGPLMILTRSDIVIFCVLGSLLCGGLIGLGFWIAQAYGPVSASSEDE